MDVMKLRATGYNNINTKKREIQSALRDRRNTRLRDLIVVRVIKRIRQGIKRRIIKEVNNTSQNANRNHENSNLRKHVQVKVNGSKSSRDFGREGQKSEGRTVNKLNDVILDKALEDIAKVEVDAFLNQGKLLTDKHLREVEIAIKKRWHQQNGHKSTLNNNYYGSKKPDSYLPNYVSSNQKCKDQSSHTPKIGSNNSRRFSDNHNTLNKNIGIGYSNDRYKNYSRLNASSCEKLPYGNNLNRITNNVSNSIMIAEKDSGLMTPISINSRSKPYMTKNKSNHSLLDINDGKLLQIEKTGSMTGSRARNYKCLVQHNLNKTLEQDQPYYQNNGNLNNRKDSSTLSGLSLKDEWAEVQLYNGVLHKMRKDYERKEKTKKIEDIRSTLKYQVIERKKVKDKEMQEKVKFDKIVEKTVIDDKRENERIRMEKLKKVNREKELRDEQLTFKLKNNQMEKHRVKNDESLLVEKLQIEIKEEKDNAIQKRLKELTECRKMITENEQAKAEVLKKRQKEKDDDAQALIRFEKHLEEQEIYRAKEKQERIDRMQARMDKMKETVIDKQDKKRKVEELRFLHEVEAREK
jgi:hypothetical protein